jgi:tRNA nucleotidyltransferase (CCA-adding enzyme)
LAINAFEVGGAVRDAIMGLPVVDRDWVVVGSTPEEMMNHGFKPVGKDFPVFIHPTTGEEYALARTERKTAKGYHGFSFHASADVTLEEDLSRRDLTINAMARSQSGQIVDPYDGKGDLQRRVFRHVSSAFKEDPVRILRLARFAARFADFSIHDSTLALMQSMVVNGEVDALVPERVWQEFSRGLMEATPSRMLQVLSQCGALAKILSTWTEAELTALCLELDRAAQAQLSLAARFSIISQYISSERLLTLRLPLEVLELGQLRKNTQTNLLAMSEPFATLQRCDLTRRPDRFDELLNAMSASHPSFRETAKTWRRLATAYCSINAGAIAAQSNDKQGMQIKEQISQARRAAVQSALEQTGDTPGDER